MARPRKLSDEEILSIIEKYIIEKPYIVSLKYTDLAKYSQEELGYKNVTYQDFSRNKKVQQAVELYKKQKEITTYIKLNSDKLEKLNFDVESIVEKYKVDLKQLKVILKVFKEGYDKAFDMLIEFDNCDKKNRNIIKEQAEIIQELKEKNKELRAKLNKQNDIRQSNKDAERLKWMYLLLNDMIQHKNFRIETNNDIVEILKNFGYTKDDTMNLEYILNKELKSQEIDSVGKKKVEQSEEKVIKIKEKKLKIPDFMK